MLRTSLPLCLTVAALALGGCDSADSNNVGPAQPGEAQDAAGEQTIGASLNQNGRFFQAARSVGLDATLAGPGPYTILVPTDEAFAQVEGGALNEPGNPQNRAEVTRIMTYHILPGVILAEDIGKAIDSGNGNAVLATMGGETLTATREGDAIVLTDGSGGQARITQADQQRSNGVVHQIDTVLNPPRPGAARGQDDGQASPANQTQPAQ